MGARGWCSVAVSRASASPVWPLSSQSWRIPIRKTLAVADAELVDGLQVSVWGPLDLNPRYGRLRLLAQRVDPRTNVGAAVLARV